MAKIPMGQGHGIEKYAEIAGGQSVTWETQLNYLYNQLGKDITENDLNNVLLNSGGGYYNLAGKSNDTLSFFGFTIGTSKRLTANYYRLKASGSSVLTMVVNENGSITYSDDSATPHASDLKLILYR